MLLQPLLLNQIKKRKGNNLKKYVWKDLQQGKDNLEIEK